VGLITKRLIGQVVVEWSWLESALDDMIWQLLGLDLEDGRALTKRTDASTKVAILNSIAPRYLDGPALDAIQDALSDINEIRDDRNFVVHGVWGMLRPDGVPIVMSLRSNSAPTEITSETFSHERLRQIANDTRKAKHTLVEIMQQLAPSPDKSP
jgi:hypothetical protein